MQDRQDSKLITGINARGEKRVYKFKLMDAETGTRIFHQYAGVAVQVHGTFVDFIVALAKSTDKEISDEEKTAYNLLGTDENVMMVIKKLPEIFTWETMAGLAKDMLCFHTVQIEDKEFVANEKGFTDYKGDPFEMYAAIVYALEANYPSYIIPLKESLMELFQDDSTPESEGQNSEGETSEK
jgi:hypothetical protein